jgi:hypothetical protein
MKWASQDENKHVFVGVSNRQKNLFFVTNKKDFRLEGCIAILYLFFCP